MVLHVEENCSNFMIVSLKLFTSAPSAAPAAFWRVQIQVQNTEQARTYAFVFPNGYWLC